MPTNTVAQLLAVENGEVLEGQHAPAFTDAEISAMEAKKKAETAQSTQALARRTPSELIEIAVNKGASAEQLGLLMDLQLRWEANEKRNAYIEALQKFKANPPDINKTKKVSYPNRDGSVTEYSHPELDKVVDVVREALKVHGLTASWRPSDVAGRITVTCVLTHDLGHVEDIATLGGPPDTSGGKNSIQAIGSTSYYLQRYTLLAGLGLTAKGQDNDGATEGMDQSAVDDYMTAIRDASSREELQKVYTEAYKSAKAAGDKNSMAAFVAEKDQRKRELF
jgi:hypothetical protein